MKFSVQQKGVFNEVLYGHHQVILVKSTAGSGKTTTMVELTKLLRSDISAYFLAFNNTIVDELNERLPGGFSANTLHSIGVNMLYRSFGSKLVLSESKYAKLFDKKFGQLKHEDPSNFNKLKYYTVELYGLFRSMLLDISDRDIVEEFAEYFGYNDPDIFALIKGLHIVAEDYNVKLGKPGYNEVDFTDMIYLPAITGHIKGEKRDFIIVDEAQDLNACQHKLIKKLLKRNGRIIAVGDPWQSIYSFAGADKNSFFKFQDLGDSVVLPLSVSYRCANAIVKEAQIYNPEISAHPNAVEGKTGIGYLSDVKEGDFVLCRTNEPLLKAYFRLLKDGKKAYIRGQEIGERYLKYVKPFKNSHLDAIFNYIVEEKNELFTYLSSKGVNDPIKTKKYQQLQDKELGLKIIAEQCNTVSQLISRIEEIFHPQKDAVILSSIHKSKGLEADRVFILRWDLIPHKMSNDYREEEHLKFVAITRAKNELYWIPWEGMYEMDDNGVSIENYFHFDGIQ